MATRRTPNEHRQSERAAARRSHARQDSNAEMRRLRSDDAAETAKRPFPIGKIIIVAIIAAIVIVAVWLFSTTLSVQVTVNGTPLAIRGAKTVQVAARESGLPLNPGDLISLKGSVLEKGSGKPLTAIVNGEQVDDLDTPLHNGDDIQFSDGGDIVETYDEMIQIIPHGAEVYGIGVFREFQNIGFDGVLSIRTGTISGETISKHVFYPESLIYSKHNPDVGDKKILALTFDDGPNATYTPQVLDVLKENGAKATFFVLGNSIQEIGNEWVVQRAYDEGHQICSHTYDNAIESGENINSLNTAAQIKEIENGRDAITQALGVEASRIVRIPEGEMNSDTLKNLRPYIDVEVGWNIDSGDTLGIEADSIADMILGATPGDVILLHDGGGDRSATVEALRIALPQLKKDGWKFVTVNDLLEYPALTY